ncbi:hypothetical protein D9758_013032 [Tetrapyrgos nigripes]|uniref:Uncharacterized protein n=1 Tax=Tetrapyrgos nigripes TaxID=182062 RepID=A0A8H5CBS9_9AGAR|nr:hypothetical protein D9758_013032 [Tetrapyrgos nigripes]
MKSDAPTTQPSDGRCQFDSTTSLAAKDSDWKATPPSCQILRAGRDAHYWQIQYYPEPLTLEDEWTKSVDISFAQTLKEEDDLFYRTFPAARSSLGSSRQWSSLAMSSPHFQGSTGFYIQPTSVGQSERSFQVDSDGDATMCSSVEQPNFTSELLGAIRSPSAMRRDVDQIGVESSVCHSDDIPAANHSLLLKKASKCKGEKIASVQEQLYGADASCVVGVTTHPISRRMSTDMDLDIDARYLAEDPPMGRLSPPPHGLDSSSPSEEHGLMVSNSSVKEEFSPIQDLNQIPSPTGTWSSLRMRSQSQTDWSNLTPSPTLRSPSDPTTLTSYGRRPSDSPSSMPSPSISTGPKPEPVETAGPSVMRLSPLPANRRPAERKKTQTLAYCMRSPAFWDDRENMQVSVSLKVGEYTRLSQLVPFMSLRHSKPIAVIMCPK